MLSINLNLFVFFPSTIFLFSPCSVDAINVALPKALLRLKSPISCPKPAPYHLSSRVPQPTCSKWGGEPVYVRNTCLAGSRMRTGKDGESSALIKLVGALSLHPPTQTHTLAVKNEAKCKISNSHWNIETHFKIVGALPLHPPTPTQILNSAFLKLWVLIFLTHIAIVAYPCTFPSWNQGEKFFFQ